MANEEIMARQVAVTRQKKPKTDWPEAIMNKSKAHNSNKIDAHVLIVIPRAMVNMAHSSL